ncbi:hypothetical protein [Kitasatospora sp. NPDC093806]
MIEQSAPSSGWRKAAEHRGAQIGLTEPKPDFQETWTLEFIRPVDEE